MFYDKDDKQIPADSCRLKHECYISPIIRLDSLFINDKLVSLQKNLYDASVDFDIPKVKKFFNHVNGAT